MSSRLPVIHKLIYLKVTPAYRAFTISVNFAQDSAAVWVNNDDDDD